MCTGRSKRRRAARSAITAQATDRRAIEGVYTRGEAAWPRLSHKEGALLPWTGRALGSCEGRPEHSRQRRQDGGVASDVQHHEALGPVEVRRGHPVDDCRADRRPVTRYGRRGGGGRARGGEGEDLDLAVARGENLTAHAEEGLADLTGADDGQPRRVETRDQSVHRARGIGRTGRVAVASGPCDRAESRQRP